MRAAAMASTPAAARRRMTGRYSAPATIQSGSASTDTPATIPAPRRARRTAARSGLRAAAERGPAAGTTAAERAAEPSGASRRAISVGSGALSNAYSAGGGGGSIRGARGLLEARADLLERIPRGVAVRGAQRLDAEPRELEEPRELLHGVRGQRQAPERRGHEPGR